LIQCCIRLCYETFTKQPESALPPVFLNACQQLCCKAFF
jgi:hypothetical protein